MRQAATQFFVPALASARMLTTEISQASFSTGARVVSSTLIDSLGLYEVVTSTKRQPSEL
jgi:hypothetical protein